MKPFRDKDARDFMGAMQFLELMWGVKTQYEIDRETGRGTVKIWLPSTEAVLHLETVDVRRVRVIERERQRFPDPPSPPSGETPRPRP